MPQHNELRLFISSTFRDLQQEREHLIKKVFPEIRALCHVRGIRFTEVDLRWGLTDEHIALGLLIRTCLDEVDKCRPYFIGITGDRYGFVPTYLDIQKDPSLLQMHEWIEDAVNTEMSISEMEAHYGVLRRRLDREAGIASDDAQDRVRFYFRKNREHQEVEPDDQQERLRLDAYQQRIRAAGVPVDQFNDVASLGELIRNELLRIIDIDFPDAKPPTPLQHERSRHDAFSINRRRAYIANPVYLNRLNDHVVSQEPPMVLFAESGSGKSSLLAYWAEQHQRKNPSAHVIEHYVGIGAMATDHCAVIRHVCLEIKERFGREEQVPSEPAKLEIALGQWLGYADHELNLRGENMVLILDGLNQLQGRAIDLTWIPDAIPVSIRLIVSTTIEAMVTQLQGRAYSEFRINALSEAERDTVAVRYLAEYRKALNAEQIRRISGSEKCAHPLFLKTVLEELRVTNTHEELEEKITSYLNATDTEDLFDHVLQRLEGDYSQQSVCHVMQLLGASRSGLDERELAEITGISRLKIATMIAGLDYHLVRNDGHLGFFHDYLRLAVGRRYLRDEKTLRSTHHMLAEYFKSEVAVLIAENRTIPRRTARELIYQLHEEGDVDSMRTWLSTIPVLLSLYQGEMQYEVLSYWSTVPDEYNITEAYRRGLGQWTCTDAVQRNTAMKLTSDLLFRLGQWTGAISFARERLALAMTESDSAEEASTRRGLGSLLQLSGQTAEAFNELSKALELFQELGEQRGVADATGDIGLALHARGEYDKALTCFESTLKIGEELSDARIIAFAVANMGLVYHSRGQHDLALDCDERLLSICEKSGDRHGITYAMWGMGIAYHSHGELDRALECFERQLSISEQLGDRRRIAQAVGSIGDVYQSRGQYDLALECAERSLRISEVLGDVRGVAYANGTVGHVYRSLGQYDSALECYQRKLSISHELGDRRSQAYAVGTIGNVHFSLGEFDTALECYQQMLTIGQELQDRRCISSAMGDIGMLHHRRHEFDLALENLTASISESRALGFRDALSEWLRGTAEVLLEVAAVNNEMPVYLPRFIVGATNGSWRALSTQHARDCVDECITISEEIHYHDSLIDARVLLARIEAAEGRDEVAKGILEAMLTETANDEQRAQQQYWLWKLGYADNSKATLALYEALFESAPKYDYKKRVEELRTVHEAT